MGFLNGRVSYTRFKTKANITLTGDHVEMLEAHKFVPHAAADDDAAGWTAGEHIFDLTFGHGKNIVDNRLMFDLRIDTNKWPLELQRAYMAIELAALAKDNPSGFASAKQKREAREIVMERLQQEAKTGKFRKHKLTPVLWDAATGDVLISSTSTAILSHVVELFGKTFGQNLELASAGMLVESLEYGDEFKPFKFTERIPDEYVWAAAKPLDFLANEFYLWLWWTLTATQADTIDLGAYELTLMLNKTLSLACPSGQRGKESIIHDAPNKLPEAIAAIRDGKMPRKLGLIMVYAANQYELTLTGENFAVSALKLPSPDEDVTDVAGINSHRLDRLQACNRYIDGLFCHFMDCRSDAKEWGEVAKSIQKWLKGKA